MAQELLKHSRYPVPLLLSSCDCQGTDRKVMLTTSVPSILHP